MMFERFTEKAIKVVMLAQEEARRLGHNFVGTEQILLGLIGESTGIAAKVRCNSRRATRSFTFALSSEVQLFTCGQGISPCVFTLCKVCSRKL